MKPSIALYRLRSLMLHLLAAAMCFLVWDRVDARWRATNFHTIHELRSEIGGAARLEIMHEMHFYVVSDRQSLARLSDQSLWPETMTLHTRGAPIDFESEEHVAVQIVPPSGATGDFTLIDGYPTFEGTMPFSEFSKFRAQLLAELPLLRANGSVTKVQDHRHAYRLFTGMDEKIR